MRNYDEFIKTAALNQDVKLRPHQQRVVDNPHNSMVIAHGVGSGKTLTSIAKFEKLKEEGKANKALILTPSGLRDNYGEEGVGKFTDSTYNIVGNSAERSKKLRGGINPDATYNIVSYELFRRDPKKYLKESGADTVIADEAQKGKNEAAITAKAMKQVRGQYKNHLALTGSLVSNGVSDALPLVDVTVNGDHHLGKNKREFENKFIYLSNSKKHPVQLRNKKLLGKEMASIIDYADYDDLKEVADMPDKAIDVKKIPLSKEQTKLYKKILKDDKAVRKLIKNKRMEFMSNEQAASAYNQLNETRKLMNSIGSVKPGISLSESARITPKTKALLDDLDNHLKTTPDGQAILLSNLVNGGTDVLEAGLKDRGIVPGRFLGKSPKNGVTEESRQQDVRDYKAGQKRVMIVSPAGAEGLSLGNTTWEGVLDPHFNPERMNQMEARGVRAGGLKGRDDRTVHINRYIATMPKKFGFIPSRLKTPDEKIYELAQKKNVQNQEFYKFLRSHQK